MASPAPRPASVPVPPSLLHVLRHGPAPLRSGMPPGRDAAAEPLHVALVGPGDQATADGLAAGLAALGHPVSRWPREESGMDDWSGADVAVALSPRATWRVLALAECRAKALLLTADEEERLGASAARAWTTDALRSGLPVLCSSAPLADRIRERHGVPVSTFAPGLDAAYRSLPTHRRDDLVLLEATLELPWRGAALALLAGQELSARRPDLELAVARGARPAALPYAVRDLGPPDPARRAEAYAEATLGVVCASDGVDPVVGEMLACGLPVIVLEDVARQTPPALGLVPVRPDPLAVADEVERLQDDLMARAERSLAGTRWAASRTWAAAASEVETALRAALRTTRR